MGFALTVPDPKQQTVPAGWAADVAAPAIKQATWDELDDFEGRLRGLASWIESLGGDKLEFEKALRLVEYRRGALLGPAKLGKPKLATHGTLTDADQVVEVATRVKFADDASPQTRSRWRKIAAGWDKAWPVILAATRASEVTQAAILRLVDGATQPDTPEPATRGTNGTPSDDEAPDTGLDIAFEQDDEPDAGAELGVVAEENERLRARIELLADDDLKRRVKVLDEEKASLLAMLDQRDTTIAELKRETTRCKRLLGMIRAALGVERDTEIVGTIKDLLR